MKRIQRRRALERVTTIAVMKVVCEEWEKITIDEINYEIETLPAIISRCFAVNGSNNSHA